MDYITKYSGQIIYNFLGCVPIKWVQASIQNIFPIKVKLENTWKNAEKNLIYTQIFHNFCFISKCFGQVIQEMHLKLELWALKVSIIEKKVMQ